MKILKIIFKRQKSKIYFEPIIPQIQKDDEKELIKILVSVFD